MNEENRKAFPKFAAVILGCAIVGGVIGFVSGFFGTGEMKETLSHLMQSFDTVWASWILVALVVFVGLYSYPELKKARALIHSGNETDLDKGEAVIEKVINATNITMVLSFLFMACSYAGGYVSFETDTHFAEFALAVVAFLVNLVLTLNIQKRCIDLIHEANPEKNASIYDLKFQQTYFEQCDEAEKILIGKAAWQAQKAMIWTCPFLAAAFAIAALMFGIGPWPAIAVCIVWLVNVAVFGKASMKAGKIR